MWMSSSVVVSHRLAEMRPSWRQGEEGRGKEGGDERGGGRG